MIHEIVVETVAAEHPGNWASAVASVLVTRGCRTQAANGSGDDIAVAVAGLGSAVEE